MVWDGPGKSIPDEGAWDDPDKGVWDNPAPVEDVPGNSDAIGILLSGENVNGDKGSTSRKLSTMLVLVPGHYNQVEHQQGGKVQAILHSQDHKKHSLPHVSAERALLCQQKTHCHY